MFSTNHILQLFQHISNSSDASNAVVWDAAPADFIPEDLTHTDAADPDKAAEESNHTKEDEVYNNYEYKHYESDIT